MTWRLEPEPERQTLGRFLDDVAMRHGDRPAIRSPERELSFTGLRGEARQLARALVGAGVGKGQHVGLWMANGPDWPVAAFAASLVGAVLVPVNTFAKDDERDHILRHGDVSLLLMQRHLLGRDFGDELVAGHEALAGAGAGDRLRVPALPQLRRVFVKGGAGPAALEPWEALLALASDVPDEQLDAISAEVAPSDDAMIIYTSGTTSMPKGVLHMQRAPVIQSWRFAELMGLSPDDRLLTAFPFFWTAGICMSLGASLAAGSLLLVDEAFDPGAALERIERERATVVHAWPHQEKEMAEHPDAGRRDLSSARKVEFTSPLAPLVGLEKDEYSTYASYGLSETFTICSALPASTPAEVRRPTHGRPLPGMTIRIVDPDTGEALPTGESGEIAVKGRTFMGGYYKVDPERYLDENGFFRTQDAGSIDEQGYLHWTGRLSNLIKTGGANVSPLEIEARALQFPGLHVSAAVGVPHPTLGEAVVLCAVPAEGHAVDAAALRAFLKEKLSAYKVPRAVLLFAEDEVQFTGNRKLQVEPLRVKARERLARDRIEIAGHLYGTGDVG
jgi:acyl-CoA synthetase (AMP-forming)/AMP-acid ligase II